MSHVPPPYAPPPDETKGLYPTVPTDQQPQPGGYPQQQSFATAPPPQTAVTYYPPTGPPQQQPQQLVVTQAPPVIVGQSQPVKSYVLHIVLSCFAFWCCGYFFGLIAFILASE